VSKPPRVSLILKLAIFATGCAGLVAEFVLSTLATYLTGNAVFQWTMVMSLMLFAMGVGSRLSKGVSQNLLDVFILVEFTLSVLCSLSAVSAYGLAGYTSNISLFIYGLALLIGGLIGAEIPLVARLNEDYEELRSNIAGVMEKDYYGALFGGLFFAFFALPRFGLTYTPIALGAINFMVASVLLWSFYHLTRLKRVLIPAFAVGLVILVGLTFLAKPIIMYGEQRQFKDKVIYAEQTRFQKIVMTRWKQYHWLFINGQVQFSTYDEEKYHEPLVHPVMTLSRARNRVLILGGGDGLALREVWTYQDVKEVILVDLDPAMTDLARHHPVLLEVNNGSMLDPRLTVINDDAAAFLKNDDTLYDVIIIDLPDPDSVDLMHLYAESFYRLCLRHLTVGGAMVTQAASPYFAKRVFLSITKTMRAAGLSVLPYHNQIPTMGEWGWVLGVRDSEMNEDRLKERMLTLDFNRETTRFLNSQAVAAMMYFGKGVFDPGWEDTVEINSQTNPVLHTYYRRGDWAMY
jgi:spermidine synthase